MSSSTPSNGGIGFVGVLTIVFVILKLTHYVDWSWWWVLAPIWISAGLALVVGLIFVLVGLLVSRSRWRRKKKVASVRTTVFGK